MATDHPRGLLPDDQPGAGSDPVAIDYTQRDVLLYTVCAPGTTRRSACCFHGCVGDRIVVSNAWFTWR